MKLNALLASVTLLFGTWLLSFAATNPPSDVYVQRAEKIATALKLEDSAQERPRA